MKNAILKYGLKKIFSHFHNVIAFIRDERIPHISGMKTSAGKKSYANDAHSLPFKN